MNLFRPKPTPTPEPLDEHAWLQRCCERLRQRYNDRELLPGGRVLNMGQLVRLFRAVRAEMIDDERANR